MNEAAFRRACVIQGRLRDIERARNCWDEAKVQSALVALVAADGAALLINPEIVLTFPVVAAFRRAVLDQLATEEALLRQEFDKL